jgi:hypothetical protein
MEGLTQRVIGHAELRRDLRARRRSRFVWQQLFQRIK